MTKRTFRALPTAAALAAAALALQACGGSSGEKARQNQPQPTQTQTAPQQTSLAHGPSSDALGPRVPQQQPAADAHHGHSHGEPGRVPAFQKTAAELKSLPATLAPQQFSGKTRLAYQAVAAIPKTIAQLPCYCHCDEGFGHKSLHSCFVDDHASHCAVCVDEALLAYRLQTEGGLTPEQIRERIVAQYGTAQ
ncbi:MAG TPA: CYCXC family (seleno)protein [Pyrinomonadaceae bacterium]|nr:CYCXC family (seleno)protein [Pyrinomonadaceae bacterium]